MSIYCKIILRIGENMRKTLFWKILIILAVILILILLVSNIALATIDTNIDTIKPDDGFSDVGNRILGVIKVVGAFVSVGMTMVVGIKYMTSSVEEKAEYKKTAIAYLIGAILIFATTQLIDFVYDFMNDQLQSSSSATVRSI